MASRIFSLRLSVFNAVLFLGAGVQLPFLPLWLSERGFDARQIAIVVAVSTAIRVLAIPAGTFIADHVGKRRLIILACACASFASYAMLGSVSGFPAILLLVSVAGALYAPVVPLTEVLTMEGSKLHGLAYGRIRLWASLGFLAGSLIAGALLEVIPVSAAVYLIAAAQGLAALMSLALPPDPVQGETAHVAEARGNLLAQFGQRGLLLLLAAAGLGQATHGVLYSFGSVHWSDQGFGKLTIGELWAVGVLCEVVLFGFSRRVFGLLGSQRLIALGVGCGLVRWILIGLEPPLWLLALAQVLHAGSFAMTHLGTMHYIQETVPARLRNSVQGIYMGLISGVLLAISMWAAGPLYAAWGGEAYFVMAGFSALALLLAIASIRISPTVPDRAGA